MGHPPDRPKARRLGVISSILLGRSFRNKSSKDVAFPHPQSRKNHYRKEDIPSWGSIVWKFFKRTINITEYWNAKDDVNPAKNRTLGDSIHGRLRERGRCIVLRSFSAKPCARVTARTVIKSPRLVDSSTPSFPRSILKEVSGNIFKLSLSQGIGPPSLPIRRAN